MSYAEERQLASDRTIKRVMDWLKVVSIILTMLGVLIGSVFGLTTIYNNQVANTKDISEIKVSVENIEDDVAFLRRKFDASITMKR